MRTNHPPEAELTEGFWDNLRDVALRKEARIELIASFDAAGEHATLVVDSVDKATGIPSVSLMHRYTRCRPWVPPSDRPKTATTQGLTDRD